MALALIIIGFLIVDVGLKNNSAQFGKLIKSDFTGAGNFWYWIVAVIIVGSVGYYQPAKSVSHLFLGLIVLVFVLSNGGVFEKFTQAIENPVAAPSNSGSAAGATEDSADTTADGFEKFLHDAIFDPTRMDNDIKDFTSKYIWGNVGNIFGIPGF